MGEIVDFDHPLRSVDKKHANNLRGVFLDPTKGYDRNQAKMSTTVLSNNLKEDETVFNLLTSTTTADQGGQVGTI